MSAEFIDEQIAYYRAQAAGYDEWFYRHGHYDQGDDANAQWFREVESVQRALYRLPRVPKALELACGTGIWTQELLKVADQVVALDASPEMLAINRHKLRSDRVTYQEKELFTWVPQESFPMVFFSFWLSHVPPDELERFFLKVAQALKPDGRVFFVDSHHEPGDDRHDVRQGIILQRKLSDGRTFKIVKVNYKPSQLIETMHKAGLEGHVHTTGEHFVWGTAVKL